MNALEPMVFTPSGIEMLLRLLHPLNASEPMLSMYAGSVTVESDTQPSKRREGIFVAMQVRLALSSDVQFAKAASPMYDTPAGTVTAASDVQP